MNPQTQNRLAALAVGAATLAYLGVKKPWKKTEPKTEDVPESKLPDHGKNKKRILEKEKSMSNSPVIQEQERDQVKTATDEHQKRNWWYSNPKKE